MPSLYIWVIWEVRKWPLPFRRAATKAPVNSSKSNSTLVPQPLWRKKEWLVKPHSGIQKVKRESVWVRVLNGLRYQRDLDKLWKIREKIQAKDGSTVQYFNNKEENIPTEFCSPVEFSHSVMSYSLRPHGLQHASPPCPSPTKRLHKNSSQLKLGRKWRKKGGWWVKIKKTMMFLNCGATEDSWESLGLQEDQISQS